MLLASFPTPVGEGTKPPGKHLQAPGEASGLREEGFGRWRAADTRVSAPTIPLFCLAADASCITLHRSMGRKDAKWHEPESLRSFR
jgi:hypothetical protein